MLKNIVEINKHKGRDPSNPRHEEYQYLNLLKDIIDEGVNEVGRNGNTRGVYGTAMHYSLENGKIPILTTKKTAWKTCLKELLWFIRGDTDNKLLNEQNVHIWDANSTPEFKRTRGLQHYIDGDLGPLYGFQWRHFNAPYSSCNEDYEGTGVDQLQLVIDSLKDPEKRTSRRMVVSAWNPCQMDQGVLPPCHLLFQFNVIDGNKLSCSLMARSQDVPLGEPFNIASYAFLTHLIAKHCDLIPYEFILYGGNCHIYEQHIDAMKEQITREPFDFPTLEILNKRDNINDYTIDDFKITGYQHHPPIKMTMVA
jgi:thymidylate synthase